jgi:hypothetical protein
MEGGLKRQYSIAIAMALCLAAASAEAQDRATAFGSVRFGETPARVAEAMAAIGLAPYTKIKADERFPLDQTFQGMLLGEQAVVMTLFDGNGAFEKMIVSFLTEEQDCLEFYGQFKDELIEKYGATTLDVHRYDYPFSDGDHVGHEQTAIRFGKGHLAATWKREDAGDHTGGIALSVEDNLTVRLTYESGKWSVESDRRKRLLNAAF